MSEVPLQVAGVLVGLVTYTKVYLSWRGEALNVKITVTVRALDFAWHPGLPGRPPLRGSLSLGSHTPVGLVFTGVPRSQDPPSP
jgi:hypothetical protein